MVLVVVVVGVEMGCWKMRELGGEERDARLGGRRGIACLALWKRISYEGYRMQFTENRTLRNMTAFGIIPRPPISHAKHLRDPELRHSSDRT